MKKIITAVVLVLVVLFLFKDDLLSTMLGDDRYLWLEEVEGKKALEWVQEQNERTVKKFGYGETYKEVYRHTLENELAVGRYKAPFHSEDLVFLDIRSKENPIGILHYLRAEEYSAGTKDWRPLLDLNEFVQPSGEIWHLRRIDCWNNDLERCLLKLSPSGSDVTFIREFNFRTKSFVSGGFQTTTGYASATWLDEDTLYVVDKVKYDENLDVSEVPALKKWKRGTPLESAFVVYESSLEDLMLEVVKMTTLNKEYVFLKESIISNAPVYSVIDDQSNQKHIPFHPGAKFLGMAMGRAIIKLKSAWETNEYKFLTHDVLALDIEGFLNGGSLNPQKVMSKLSYIFPTKWGMYGVRNERGESDLFSIKESKQGYEVSGVPFKSGGVKDVLFSHPKRDQAVVIYSDYIEPLQIFRVEQTQITQLLEVPIRVNLDQLQVKFFEATSKDGTKVPYTLISRKDLKFDRENPTLMYGYGGYGTTVPRVQPTSILEEWVSKGGVYVIAHVRGGGKKGEDWHSAAKLTSRHKSFEDFVAIAEDLIRSKITSPKRLGMAGGSNGGLLVGAVMTKRPDLFNAVISDAPVLDMLRIMEMPAITGRPAQANIYPEFGNPSDPDMRIYMESYSPFHNLRENESYPEPFFYTTTSDDRVAPGHARKMAAKMIDMGYEAWLYEPRDGGHGHSVDMKKSVHAFALKVQYLFDKLF